MSPLLIICYFLLLVCLIGGVVCIYMIHTSRKKIKKAFSELTPEEREQVISELKKHYEKK